MIYQTNSKTLDFFSQICKTPRKYNMIQISKIDIGFIWQLYHISFMISPCSESPELRFWADCLKSKISAHSQANPTINSRGPKIFLQFSNKTQPTNMYFLLVPPTCLVIMIQLILFLEFLTFVKSFKRFMILITF